MADQLLHYNNRFDPSKDYDQHMFRSGYVLQAAELNEIQSNVANRVKGIADALFKDGDLIRDAGININANTGLAKCAAGALYLRGAVRGVNARDITIPLTAVVSIGVYLVEKVITEVDDPALRDPASEVRNYQEPGAGRMQVSAVWGWQAPGNSDGQAGEFYPVYTADFGVLRVKAVPPQLDSVSQAVARYDRDSTGGSYVVSGLKVTKLPDVAGQQQYSVAAGGARVNGYAVDLPASRRIGYPAAAEIKLIDAEPFLSATNGAQRVTFDRTPVQNITQVRITKQTTSEIVHGAFNGAQDPLPESSIVEIVSITQGGTVFVQGTDFKLTGQRVDWSLPGVEPGIGTTYSVVYRHIATVQPTAVDATGFTVTGAVVGTLILTSYNVKLPRFDRLCLTQDGTFQWIQGTSTDFNPVPPQVPPLLLPLAQVRQSWDGAESLVNDGLRVIPMKDLEQLNTNMQTLFDLVAQQNLKSDLNARSSAAKKGVFVDPFLNDGQRDAGIAQTAAIVNGELMLPISCEYMQPNADVKVPVSLAATLSVVFEQRAITGSMKINPYMGFAPIPASLQLDPPVDRFTVTNNVYTSDETSVMVDTHWSYHENGIVEVTVTTQNQTRLASTTTLPFLREIDIEFQIDGFSPNEALSAITFDGIGVIPSAV